jgi:hypothetical protein
MRLIAFTFLFCFILSSCSKDSQPLTYPDMTGCRDTVFTFDNDILPIMNVNCNFSECHATGGRGSYDFTKYKVVVNSVKSGSLEYRLKLPYGDPQHMPEDMKLSRCDENTIIAWIRQGYPEK